MPPRGRRPGKSGTRDALLRAARRRFAEQGYDKTAVRSIAADAGVDPGLIVHFFGGKDGLFRATMDWPFDPADLAERVVGPGTTGVGERLAQMFFESWEHPDSRAPLLAILRGASTHEESALLVREFVQGQIYAQLAAAIGGDDAELRIDLAMGQLLGVAYLRYVLQVDPIASVPVDELITMVAPLLEHHLQPDG